MLAYLFIKKTAMPRDHLEAKLAYGKQINAQMGHSRNLPAAICPHRASGSSRALGASS